MLERRRLAMVVLILFVSCVAGSSHGQPPTMGLLLNVGGAFEGYTLFECMHYPATYLINIEGRLVHSWQHDRLTANMVYLLANGNLLRGTVADSPYFNSPGAGGLVQECDWDGNLLWEFAYVSATYRHHHDIARLPNGNVLMIAWERKSASEAIAAGRNPALLPDGEVWTEHIVEVEPAGASGGYIVWEWHAWDHLIQDFDPTKNNYGTVADHPELIDINFTPNGTRDWLHANAVAYNEDFDQIVISINRFREFWIIDHGTTTAEAAGHTGGLRGMGGDILYRWGNPRAYDRGTSADQKLFFQHDTDWIEDGLAGEGHILLFNNGVFRPGGAYSSVEEVETTVDASGDYPIPPPGVPHGPTSATWTYTATPPEDLFSSAISGAQRLPNGNTLICEGNWGTLWEIDPQETLVWMYVNPVNSNGPMRQGDPPTGNATFRVYRYGPDYPGFEGRDLTPGGPIEIYPTTDVFADTPVVAPLLLLTNYPNPVCTTTNIAFSISRRMDVSLSVYDVGGRRVALLVDRPLAAGEHVCPWKAGRVPAGVYYAVLGADGLTKSRKMVVTR